jgi:hypothetical protein
MMLARWYVGMLLACVILGVLITALARAALWLLVFAPDALFGAICLTFVIGVFVLMLGRELGK